MSSIVALAVMTGLTAPGALANSHTTTTPNWAIADPIPQMPNSDLLVVGFLAALALIAAD
jgi:hypothetical protein